MYEAHVSRGRHGTGAGDSTLECWPGDLRKPLPIRRLLSSDTKIGQGSLFYYGIMPNLMGGLIMNRRRSPIAAGRLCLLHVGQDLAAPSLSSPLYLPALAFIVSVIRDLAVVEREARPAPPAEPTE